MRKLLVVMGVLALPMSWYNVSPTMFTAGLISAAAMSGAILLTPRGKDLEIALKFSFGLIGVLAGGWAGRVVHELLALISDEALLVVPGGVMGLVLAWRLSAFLGAKVRRSADNEIRESQSAGAKPRGKRTAERQPERYIIPQKRVVVVLLSLALVLVIGVYHELRLRREHRVRAAIAQLRTLERGCCILRSSRGDFDYIMAHPAVVRLENLGHITDAELECLKWLNLQTQIGDATLEHLKGMTRLTHLGVNDTQVTDAGLKYVEGLADLQWLDLNNTQITDAGLNHLQGLPKLQRLDLRNTRVTDAGVADLQKALPGCRIQH